MENINVFIDKEEINKLFDEEKYKNCMDKKYFEYIVSNNKIEYIDKYLKYSKDRRLIESLVFQNKVVLLIDKLTVRVENNGYTGELENSGIDNIRVSKEMVNKYHDKILTNGVFSLITLEENIDKKYKYYIEKIEVLEDINVNLEDYKKYFSKRVRKYRDEKSIVIGGIEINDEEYDSISEIELILNTIGISTKEFTFWEKILFLVRLIPLCEANYNLMELGGNGLGKTKTYSMFSPECEIVQEMSVAELIYNRQSKEKGLLAKKDVIVFDEINKMKIDSNNEKIIPQLLNFMSDGQTTSPRKVISKTSLVFSGNVMGIQARLEKNEKDIFDDSHKLEDNAFFDRIHFFLPAWGLRRYSRNIHGSGLSKKIFRFDYFSKVLSLLREKDYSDIIDERQWIIRGKNESEREVKAIRKTVSGLIKLTHPDKEIDDFTLGAYIAIAIKGRGLVNKFLNNKNKRNVNKIDIEIIRIDYNNKGEAEEISVPVNEMLKHFIELNHSDELNEYFEIYKENMYNHFNLNYRIFFSNNNYFGGYSQMDIQKIENNIFYSGKFYPNRQIIVFNNKGNQGEIVFVKFALDKLGIEKNIREERMIKECYGNRSDVSLLNNARILIFANQGLRDSWIPKSFSHGKVVTIEDWLRDDNELNYDELFGDQSLDENEFTGANPSAGTRNLEADLSNFYFLDKNKKLKCENGDYVIPEFKYSEKVDKYFYEYLDEREGKPEISEMMTYVEFKYFLAENGFIKLND